MNYPEELRERYNEVMYDERDIIEKFLKDQYDIRYGRQRDTWHFEPAVKLMNLYGNEINITDVMLDKDVFVKFIGTFCSERDEYECFHFAYGELSKVIEALPDAKTVNMNNAIDDLKYITRCYNVKAILAEHPFLFGSQRIDDVEDGGNDEGIKLCIGNTFTHNIASAIELRDHLNVCILHGYREYKTLVKFLSLEPNLCFEPANLGDVMFTIHGTDVKVDVLSAYLDSNENLMLCVEDGGEKIFLNEKDIRPEYLVDLVGYIQDHRLDIMDTYNGHNPELVRKINAAWKSDKYQNRFGDILFALARRDEEEIGWKYGDINMEIQSSESAMNYAHEIMEGVCDDMDLETILSFIRYEE